MKGPRPKPEAERFWPKVEKTETCWLWTATIDAAGYGRFGVGSMYDGSRRQAYAHRWAYEYMVGEIPEGLHIDHLCRVRHCVRPDHLEPVTCRENLLRGDTFVRVNAAKTHCLNGHPFDEKNTYWNATRSERICRACRAARMRLYAARKKTA